jgi:hypothetical protein
MENEGFEVLTAVVMNSSIFWDIMPCSPLEVNQRFGEICHLSLQSRRMSQARNQRESKWQFSTLKMGATYSSEPSVYFQRTTWRYIQENTILLVTEECSHPTYWKRCLQKHSSHLSVNSFISSRHVSEESRNLRESQLVTYPMQGRCFIPLPSLCFQEGWESMSFLFSEIIYFLKFLLFQLIICHMLS